MGSQNRIGELHSFLREVKDRPFQLGVWDCLIFTNEAFKRMDGEGWGEDLLRRYVKNNQLLTRIKMRQEYGFHSTNNAGLSWINHVEDLVSDRMKRVDNVPPRGALVTSSEENLQAEYLGLSFGISVGSSAAFLSKQGVVYCPIEYIDSAWVKE